MMCSVGSGIPGGGSGVAGGWRGVYGQRSGEGWD